VSCPEFSQIEQNFVGHHRRDPWTVEVCIECQTGDMYLNDSMEGKL
jgi:hypothetical protein